MIGLSQKLSTSANYGYPFAGLPGGVYACIPSGCGHRALAPCLRKGLLLTKPISIHTLYGYSRYSLSIPGWYILNTLFLIPSYGNCSPYRRTDALSRPARGIYPEPDRDTVRNEKAKEETNSILNS